jgi:dTDP-4-dehydrorhamnose reductase
MQKAVLIGSNGQLGSELARLWQASPWAARYELANLTHADINITDRDQVHSVIGEMRPVWLINTAGFLRVDECERVPEVAMQVNGIALKYLCEACEAAGATLMHFSTDYVFDGRKAEPYDEDDTPAPINAYGISKLAGEQFVRYGLPRAHLIVRTSGLFGPTGSASKGGNFVETMLRLAAADKSLSVVDDQVFSPSYAPDVAAAALRLMEGGAHGTFHVTNAGTTSWYGFAKRAFELAGLTPDLRPVSTETYAAPAPRPRYSVLDNAKARDAGVPQPRGWEDALADYTARRGS